MLLLVFVMQIYFILTIYTVYIYIYRYTINNHDQCVIIKNINNLGCLQEFEQKLHSALRSKAELNDFSDQLRNKYSKQVKNFDGERKSGIVIWNKPIPHRCYKT